MMSARIDLYEPINTLKPVADNIWIVDGPEISFYKMPFSTRMTIIRLSNGDLFIHSPTPLSETLKTEVDKLGRVAHLVSPNFIHYWWIKEWGNAYPDAIKWASPNVRKRAGKHDITFDKDLRNTPEDAWSNDIDQIIISAPRGISEVEFFHKPSRTLILTDFIENFEAGRIHSRLLKLLMWIGGLRHPDGKMPIDIYLSALGRLKELRASVQIMVDWAPEKIILAHGHWYTKNGVAELKRAFRRLGTFD
jgi:hypothetical protein